MIYPLRPKVDTIVATIREAIEGLDLKPNEKADLKRFAGWVGDELAVNARFKSCEKAVGFSNDTMELIFEKDYLSVQELKYKKHWPMHAPLFRYQEVTSELTARLKRTELRLV